MVAVGRGLADVPEPRDARIAFAVAEHRVLEERTIVDECRHDPFAGEGLRQIGEALFLACPHVGDIDSLERLVEQCLRHGVRFNAADGRLLAEGVETVGGHQHYPCRVGIA